MGYLKLLKSEDALRGIFTRVTLGIEGNPEFQGELLGTDDG